MKPNRFTLDRRRLPIGAAVLYAPVCDDPASSSNPVCTEISPLLRYCNWRVSARRSVDQFRLFGLNQAQHSTRVTTLWYPVVITLPQFEAPHDLGSRIAIKHETTILKGWNIAMISDVMKDAEQRMNKALDSLHKNLNSIRTGRANPALVDRVMVDYYGSSTPLTQIAGVSAPEARMLVIQPYDRSSIPAIEKAIMQSDLGLNPSNDGQLIRLSIPTLTEDRRKQMVKTVHSTVEVGKVSLRNVRRDAVQQTRELLSKKDISEDDERRAAQDLDSITKKHIEDAEKIGKAKEQEVLEV